MFTCIFFSDKKKEKLYRIRNKTFHRRKSNRLSKGGRSQSNQTLGMDS